MADKTVVTVRYGDEVNAHVEIGKMVYYRLPVPEESGYYTMSGMVQELRIGKTHGESKAVVKSFHHDVTRLVPVLNIIPSALISMNTETEIERDGMKIKKYCLPVETL